MKVLAFVLAGMVCSILYNHVQINDGIVKIHYNGVEIQARQLVKGQLNLYVSHRSELKRVTGPLYRKRKTVFVKRYFIKYQKQVEKVSPYNYKRVLKKYLHRAQELHTRLGKLGFRYGNIPSIVRYYNQFVVPEFYPDLPPPDPVDDMR